MRFAFIAIALGLLSCKSSLTLGTGVALGFACQPGLSARVCRCDDGSNGAQYCNADGNDYLACDCTLVLSAAICTSDFQPGEEAKCVATVPDCVVSIDHLTADHRVLNGTPAGAGGDRTSGDGTPYQVAMTVTTSVEDNQPVTIEIDGQPVANGKALAGRATFSGVTVSGDGAHEAKALCTSLRGAMAIGKAVAFASDATAPDFAFSTAPGTHIAPAADADPAQAGLQFTVCASTTAADVAPSGYCVGIGGGTPVCGDVAGGMACVLVQCPGGAPFQLNGSLTDGAGNVTIRTLAGISCASAAPSAQIVHPTTGTGVDPTTHVLSASAAQSLRDADAGQLGAQLDVVACSDATGGTAKLFAGLTSQQATLLAEATLVPALPADGCPPQLGAAAHFTHVTLPESAELNSGALEDATRLRVDVTDLSSEAGQSPTVDVWVDSHDPLLVPWDPSSLCNYVWANPAYTSIGFLTPGHITLHISNSAGVASYVSTTSYSFYEYVHGVVWATGPNTMTVDAPEPSGNVGRLPTPCVVTFDPAPQIYWMAPEPAGSIGLDDVDPDRAGQQVQLRVYVDLAAGGTVSFEKDGVPLPVLVAASGASGVTGPTTTVDCGLIPYACIATAEVDASAFTDGVDAVVKATAVDPTPSGRGTGTSSITVHVDFTAPGAPTGLTAAVKSYRQTSFHLSWLAQDAYAHYDVRVSKAPLTPGNVDAALRVTYVGTPAASGSLDGTDVGDLLIETTYYFAVAGVDLAGNRGPFQYTAAPIAAHFRQTVLAAPGTLDTYFGASSDGASSINGDALSDLLVATFHGDRAYAYFGRPTGYAATPDIVFSGLSGTNFGSSVSVIGDVDGDGKDDLAIGAPLDNTVGSVFIFRGRTLWPASLSASDADYVVTADPSDPHWAAAMFGGRVQRLGDFNLDGVDDFAISAGFYNGAQGAFAIVMGQAGTFAASQQIPQDLGPTLALITGNANPAFVGNFASELVGIGPFFGNTPGLVATDSGYVGYHGDGYLFRGGTGWGGAYPFDVYDQRAYTPTAINPMGNDNGWYGTALTLVGPLLGSAAIALAAPRNAAGANSVYVYMGGSQALFDPARRVEIYDSNEGSAGSYTARDGFGSAIAGGGFSGQSRSVSFIGGRDPDLFVTALKEGNGATVAPLYLFDGATLAANVGGSIDAVTGADVTIPLPSGWMGSAYESAGTITDLNGDGYPDFAVAEDPVTYPSPGDNGKVLVLW